MIFNQWSTQLFKCLQQTKNFNQRRNGNLAWRICSNKEHVYVYRPNIVKTWLPCRRYTVQFHAWENEQHACYSTIPLHPTPLPPTVLPLVSPMILCVLKWCVEVHSELCSEVIQNVCVLKWCRGRCSEMILLPLYSPKNKPCKLYKTAINLDYTW